MSDDLPLDELRPIPLLRNFSEADYRELARIARTVRFAAGERILAQGRTSQNLWILLEGSCRVSMAGEDGQEVELAELAAHQSFGEMSFFHAAPHSANVEARTSVRLLQIARSDFDQLTESNCSAAYKLAANTVESLADRIRRMDEWVGRLLADGGRRGNRVDEWKRFRTALFRDGGF